MHGLGVQTAEGMAEWLHAKVRADLGVDAGQGRRYSWGYPAVPEQSEHEKVFRLLDAPSIGMRLSGGFAVEPEQSTLAIIAYHPQAVYYGMRSGIPAQAGRDDARPADQRHRTRPGSERGNCARRSPTTTRARPVEAEVDKPPTTSTSQRSVEDAASLESAARRTTAARRPTPTAAPHSRARTPAPHPTPTTPHSVVFLNPRIILHGPRPVIL